MGPGRRKVLPPKPALFSFEKKSVRLFVLAGSASWPTAKVCRVTGSRRFPPPNHATSFEIFFGKGKNRRGVLEYYPQAHGLRGWPVRLGPSYAGSGILNRPNPEWVESPPCAVWLARTDATPSRRVSIRGSVHDCFDAVLSSASAAAISSHDGARQVCHRGPARIPHRRSLGDGQQ